MDGIYIESDGKVSLSELNVLFAVGIFRASSAALVLSFFFVFVKN